MTAVRQAVAAVGHRVTRVASADTERERKTLRMSVRERESERVCRCKQALDKRLSLAGWPLGGAWCVVVRLLAFYLFYTTVVKLCGAELETGHVRGADVAIYS